MPVVQTFVHICSKYVSRLRQQKKTGGESIMFLRSSVPEGVVRCPSINTNFTWRDISSVNPLKVKKLKYTYNKNWKKYDILYMIPFLTAVGNIIIW